MADTKKTMIKCAAQKILLCDSSKFEKYRLAKFADFNDIDFFITDTMNEKIKTMIENFGVEIIFS